ncbi:MAG TPA: histidinol-phosphatase [candidate division Zixibacteria bacterium]
MEKNQPSDLSGLAKSDWHVHPDYSLDATGTIDQYCRRALELGLEEICFTTHYDSDPFRKDEDPFMRINGKLAPLCKENVQRYINEVEDTGRKYNPSGLRVKVGLEVDYAPHIEEELRHNLSSFNLDYVLGAVHCLDHIAISASNEAERYFVKRSMEETVEEYYNILKQAVTSDLFDAVAHLDIYKKYGLGFYGENILILHRGLVEPVLGLMVLHNVGMEINTGVLRKGHREFCPGMEILKTAMEMGVEIEAIGSDAHKIEHLGMGIEETYHIVENLKREIEKKRKSAVR